MDQTLQESLYPPPSEGTDTLVLLTAPGPASPQCPSSWGQMVPMWLSDQTMPDPSHIQDSFVHLNFSQLDIWHVPVNNPSYCSHSQSFLIFIFWSKPVFDLNNNNNDNNWLLVIEPFYIINQWRIFQRKKTFNQIRVFVTQIKIKLCVTFCDLYKKHCIITVVSYKVS